MDSIAVIRNFMVENGLCYLLVNSTNEFLVEYNTLEENSRYKLTGFSGSTGEALVTPDKIYLFVDGRYHIQADNEVDHEKVTVVKLQTGQKYLDELVNLIPENEILGIFAKKNSQKKYEILSQKRQIKLLKFDPAKIYQIMKIKMSKLISNIPVCLLMKKYQKFHQNYLKMKLFMLLIWTRFHIYSICEIFLKNFQQKLGQKL